MQRFHQKGIFVWVSREPILYVSHTLAKIAATHDFVDFDKLGPLDHMSLKRPIDLRNFTLRY